VSLLDWLVLVATLGGIVLYGVWASRGQRDEEYLRGGDLPWLTIGLSVMATQASAITFLSTPGLAFEEGMRFVQFYFGMPLAVIVVAAVFVPIFYRLRVLTAYEYLETRFDVRVRVLGATLFLVQRGLAAGITIYAPSIVLSTILGWSLSLTIVIMGASVIVYTVTGGTAVVSQTQKQQMIVILLGMVAAGVFLARQLPDGMTMDDAAALAGLTGRMEIVDLEPNFRTRYNVWSGLAGGFFLALSYFGTDQSQVQRYLAGKSSSAGRLGLLFNGLFKVPMQFSILFLGVLLYVFYVFSPAPAFFDPSTLARARTAQPAAVAAVEQRVATSSDRRRRAAEAYLDARHRGSDTTDAGKRYAESDREVATARKETKSLIAKAVPGASIQDGDFVFITFVLTRLPAGLIGLLIAVILCAAMSSISGELNALGTTSAFDLYQRFRAGTPTEAERVVVAKRLTVAWGLIAVGFASVASLFDNLIEAVNVLGSLFYGTVLGLFVVAFFLKWIGARAVFWASLVALGAVFSLFLGTQLGFLWYNVIGCAVVVGIAAGLEVLWPARG
jgi:solute:Na+ symporter, SSS family